jgi:hypothetical protein
MKNINFSLDFFNNNVALDSVRSVSISYEYLVIIWQHEDEFEHFETNQID